MAETGPLCSLTQSLSHWDFDHGSEHLGLDLHRERHCAALVSSV